MCLNIHIHSNPYPSLESSPFMIDHRFMQYSYVNSLLDFDLEKGKTSKFVIISIFQ